MPFSGYNGATMASKQAQIHYQKLLTEVQKHARLYHELDAPEISDEAYDALVRELLEYEKKYPELKIIDTPTEKVGGAPSGVFAKVHHEVSQYSFDNVFTHEELIEGCASKTILGKRRCETKANVLCRTQN
jgi:DNA ligase (NAD+)